MVIRRYYPISPHIHLGGFAHVYVVRLSAKMKLADGSVGDIACLKRVVAPDKEALAIVRTEVDTMVFSSRMHSK